ncbi:MAG: helix-turn-helix transcriptional regulator [Chitinophagaceae bacterium]|nr:helix-turn-helix transcriptional regulator [Chitinophagaceae bacterium]MCB9044535.1 helix-turn-helix transcriptional regulator [Chitinophagales bacterium]
MIISYREYKPSTDLQPYVESYWYQEFDGNNDEESPLQVCLPLGMAQIIINLEGDKCLVGTDGNVQYLPEIFVVGLYTDKVIWKTKGHSTYFGICLKPESIERLFKAPVSTMFNGYAELSCFLDKSIHSFTDSLFGAADVYKLIDASEQFLRSRLSLNYSTKPYLAAATDIIRNSKGQISVDQLCKTLYVSERQLQRSFKEVYGTGPKTYTRIIRFRHAYEYAQQVKNDNLSWLDISHSFGYADQAHFIRDFKQFTGTIPSSIVAEGNQFYQLSNITDQ